MAARLLARNIVPRKRKKEILVQKLNRSLLVTACGFEVAFLSIIGFGVAPTMAGNLVAFAWITLMNALFLLIGLGMLWSDQFAESWNNAMGERSEPKLSWQEVKVEIAKIAAHPVMILVNVACIFWVK